MLTYLGVCIPVTAVAVAGLGSFEGMFRNSSAGIVFAFFYAFNLSILAYCYLMTAFFSKSTVCHVMALLAVSSRFSVCFCSGGRGGWGNCVLRLLPRVVRV